VSEDVKIKYDEIKKKKTQRYLVFFIKDEKTIAVEKIGGRDSSYDQFLGDLMACGPEDCRYGLYDFEYDHQCQGTSEKTRKEKLLLMSWCPDTARIKKKMLYSSSFDALKKCLVGVQKYIQAGRLRLGRCVRLVLFLAKR
jgi:cofilin